MPRSNSFFILVAGLTVAFLALTGPIATASAKPAQTKITLDNDLPRLYGYLESGKPSRCSKNRKVTVFEVSKDGPDRVIGTGHTRRFRGSWQWSLFKPSGPGRFYARAAARPGCAKADSRVAKGRSAPTGQGDYCPDTSAGSCLIGTQSNYLAFSSGIGEVCRKFEGRTGDCDGRGYNGAPAFSGYRPANFHWNQASSSTFRGAAFYNENGSYLEGSLPGPFSNRFSVRDAKAAGDAVPGRHWCTPDLPKADPGELGGPINFDFVNLTIGASVHFWGWVSFKGPHNC